MDIQTDNHNVLTMQTIYKRHRRYHDLEKAKLLKEGYDIDMETDEKTVFVKREEVSNIVI